MITTIIRKLPAPAEFCLIVVVCSWWAIYASFLAIANHSWSTTNRPQEVFTGVGVELDMKGPKGNHQAGSAQCTRVQGRIVRRIGYSKD
jgi:hypothetical protein